MQTNDPSTITWEVEDIGVDYAKNYGLQKYSLITSLVAYS